MKQRSWLLVFIILLLAAVACAPIASPRVVVVVTATKGIVENASSITETPEAVTEAEVELAAPSITFPRPGSELSGRALELTGTGEPGRQVQVVVDDKIIDTTEIDSDGSWSLDVSLSEPGKHDIKVQILGAGGNVLAEAEPISVLASFEIASESSTADAEDITEDATEEEIELEVPRMTFPRRDSELSSRVLEVTGTGEPDSRVQLLVDDEVIDETTVSSDGSWSLEISLTKPGEQELRLQLLDADGVVIMQTRPVNISAEFEIVAPSFIFPADGADIFLGNLTVIGTGEPGTEVEVLIDEDMLDVVNVEDAGEWALTFQPGAGVHQLSARPPGEAVEEDALIEVRVVSPSDDYNCDSNPGLVLDELYIVGTCDTLSTIGQQLGVEFEELVSANPQISEPDLIYPGQSVFIPQ